MEVSDVQKLQKSKDNRNAHTCIPDAIEGVQVWTLTTTLSATQSNPA